MADQSGEARSATIVGTIAAAIMIAGQVGSKATRDAVFLDVFSASELPKAMLAAAVLSALTVLVVSQAMSRLGPQGLVPALFVISGFAYGGEYLLLPSAPKVAAAIVYLPVAVLGSLLVSGFWSLVSERFDPHTAKKVFGRITLGATAGGLIGGVTAERVAALFDARTMLLVLAGMNLCGALAVFLTGRGGPKYEAQAEGGAGAGLRFLSETPYLKLLGVLVALTAVMSGVLDYALKAAADEAYDSRESLMSFFAIFYTATSLITLIAQSTLNKRALARFGIGGTIALLPAMVLIGGVLGAAMTRLWTLVVVRGIESVLSNSLYRSGYELLFTPLSPERKRPTKTVIDVGFDRLGGALASGAVMLALALSPATATRAAVLVAVVAAALALVTALRLHRGYIAELAESLRLGRVKLSDSDIVDATTRKTLADTTMAIDREQLLAQIDVLRQEQGGRATLMSGSRPPDAVQEDSAAAGPDRPTTEALLAQIGELLSGDLARATAVLRPPVDRHLVGHIIPLLADASLARAARRALKQAARKVTGQLIDAMLDDQQPAAVRRRLPDIIEPCQNERAARGLFAGLDSDLAIVRERCAFALRDLTAAQPTLQPPKRQAFEAAIRALEREPQDKLTHVFVILGLALEPEPLELSLSALRSDDTNLRGTSYEYLENVLPSAVRQLLWPRLKEYGSVAPPKRKAPQRSEKQMADELRQSMASLQIDRTALGLGPKTDQ